MRVVVVAEYYPRAADPVLGRPGLRDVARMFPGAVSRGLRCRRPRSAAT